MHDPCRAARIPALRGRKPGPRAVRGSRHVRPRTAGRSLPPGVQRRTALLPRRSARPRRGIGRDPCRPRAPGRGARDRGAARGQVAFRESRAAARHVSAHGPSRAGHCAHDSGDPRRHRTGPRCRGRAAPCRLRGVPPLAAARGALPGMGGVRARRRRRARPPLRRRAARRRGGRRDRRRGHVLSRRPRCEPSPVAGWMVGHPPARRAPGRPSPRVGTALSCEWRGGDQSVDSTSPRTSGAMPCGPLPFSAARPRIGCLLASWGRRRDRRFGARGAVALSSGWERRGEEATACQCSQ